MTSKSRYFTTYQSPNIVIDPNKSLVYPPMKKIKIVNERVNTNLRILQDNEIHNKYRKMDSSVVKKENKDNLNKPINSEIFINKTALCKDLNKSHTISMEENISSKTKFEENYKPDNSQTENALPQDILGVIQNSNINLYTSNTVLNKNTQVAQDKQFYKSLSSKINTEINNNIAMMDKCNKEGNCSNSENDNKTNTEINKTSFENNIKETKEDTMPKKIKETTKNREQINRKYGTKVISHEKNKSEKPRKIKITINITYNNLHSKNNIKPTNTIADSDLSFLDDFDVDEVVECLFNGKEQNSPIIKPIIDTVEKTTENSKKRETTDIEHTNINHKESCLKQTSRVDKTKETKKLNIEKEPPAAVATENNKGNNENDQTVCSVLPKININSESNIISTENKNVKVIKKEIVSEDVKCVDVDHKHNCQSIINNFVTKSDKELAHNLETKMYDNLKEKYSVLAVTHYGKFSKIFKCTDTSGHCYAVKIMDNPATNYTKGKKEKILHELIKDIPEENLHCIYLLHSFLIDKHWCYVTNYYPINLEQLLTKTKFHIGEIQQLAKQLVEAVTVLRSKNIVHHDIKPSHILLDNKTKNLTLCGFDEAIHYVNSDNLKSNIGTINYASPEKILGHSHGFPVDIWATALVIYEMATNTMLFTGTTDNEVLFKQMNMLGYIPENIIRESKFKNVHFRGTTFIRKGKNQYSDVRINNFEKNSDIYSSIIAAQSSRKHGGIDKKNIDKKLQYLISLLGKMLILDPRKRLPIEYVYADNFFFNKTI